METLQPTYEEGVTRGREAQSKIDEERRLADVFSRDASHIETLLDSAKVIRRGLGQVASGLGTGSAPWRIDGLIEELEKMEADAIEQRAAHEANRRALEKSGTPAA